MSGLPGFSQIAVYGLGAALLLLLMAYGGCYAPIFCVYVPMVPVLQKVG